MKRSDSSRIPDVTRWRWPSARATALTSSRVSQPARLWQWIGSLRSTSDCQIAISSCTGVRPSRRNCKTSLTSTAAIFARLGACRSKRFNLASNTACEDQRRHRQPACHHRRDSQSPRRKSREVRSPRLPQARSRGDEASLHRPHDGVWTGGKCGKGPTVRLDF